MTTHPKTVRILTDWLASSSELLTEVADFSALYEPGVLDDADLVRNFPMLPVRRLTLSHASSPDVLQVAQNADTGEFLAVVIVPSGDARSIVDIGSIEMEQRYRR